MTTTAPTTADFVAKTTRGGLKVHFAEVWTGPVAHCAGRSPTRCTAKQSTTGQPASSARRAGPDASKDGHRDHPTTTLHDRAR